MFNLKKLSYSDNIAWIIVVFLIIVIVVICLRSPECSRAERFANFIAEEESKNLLDDTIKFIRFNSENSNVPNTNMDAQSEIIFKNKLLKLTSKPSKHIIQTLITAFNYIKDSAEKTGYPEKKNKINDLYITYKQKMSKYFNILDNDIVFTDTEQIPYVNATYDFYKEAYPLAVEYSISS